MRILYIPLPGPALIPGRLHHFPMVEGFWFIVFPVHWNTAFYSSFKPPHLKFYLVIYKLWWLKKDEVLIAVSSAVIWWSYWDGAIRITQIWLRLGSGEEMLIWRMTNQKMQQQFIERSPHFLLRPCRRASVTKHWEISLQSTRSKRPVFGRQQWGLPSPPRLPAQHSGTFKYPSGHNTEVKTIPIEWIELGEVVQVGLNVGDKSPIKQDRRKLQKETRWKLVEKQNGNMRRRRRRRRRRRGASRQAESLADVAEKERPNESKEEKIQTAGKGRVGRRRQRQRQRQGTVQNAN